MIHVKGKKEGKSSDVMQLGKVLINLTRSLGTRTVHTRCWWPRPNKPTMLSLVEVCLEQNVVTQMLGGSRGATAGMVFS
jgi:hypothetical protein